MAQSKIIAIAAIGINRGLGKNNDLIYKIPEDMKHFRDETLGHPVITGRKNFESMGRALPGRPTIVVTRDTEYKPEGITVVHTIEDAIQKGRAFNSEKIFIIGGGEIYKAALPYTDQLDLTLIEDSKEADVFFPEYLEFSKIISETKKEYEGTSYSFLVLEREN
ncbi:dihydrofolate reductase [Patescibacteria group bacterium]|nr:MAG: dihydrofolate reductase [Patescibacteria group bacterium]